MASQNEIVWKKDLTDIQSGLETLATKTKIWKKPSRETAARPTAARLVRGVSRARPARDAKSARPVRGAKRARDARSASIT